MQFEVTSKDGKKVRVTEAYWNFIITLKHPTMTGKENLAMKTLADPDEIRQSSRDKSVFLYYKKQDAYWACVVCKHLNGEGFIITTYITDRIKEGNRVWKK
ncbi:TPA: DUF4258 domain-containing protein [Candidatus Micrarchaeota archaeon]|nr:DUF4258 domain-containing protein [Candidatus Micrarchaeota archaeon]